MSDARIITQVTLNKGEVLTKKKIATVQPNYYKVGNGSMNRQKIQAIDLIDVLMDCSRPAQQVFRWIKNEIVWDPYENRINYIAVLPRRGMGKAQEKLLDRGMPELMKLGLVRRLKPGHYMVNPHALIPDNFSMWLKAWKIAGGEVLESNDVDAYLIDNGQA